MEPWATGLLCEVDSVMTDPFATSWTVARQAPLSMGFSRQEYWRGLPYPPPGDLPDPGIKPGVMSPAPAGGFFTTSARTSALIKVTQRALLPLPPRVDTVRRQPSVNQKAGSHQTLDLLVP